MKKSLGVIGGVILSFMAISAHAQTEPTTKPVVQPQQTTPIDTVNRWNPKNNPAVSDINEKYKDKYVAAKPAMTTADIYPVIGKYESSVNMDAPSVTISLDPENKGMVWIEGLPQGKVKAMLRKSPATYKIPVQKTEDGKDIAEGTAIYDKETKTLNMVIGKSYNTLDPISVFAPEPVVGETTTSNTEKIVVKKKKNKIKTKEVAKVKPWMYVGTKVETTVATN